MRVRRAAEPDRPVMERAMIERAATERAVMERATIQGIQGIQGATMERF